MPHPEPDVLNPPAWEDDYLEFVEELKLYFRSSDLIGESENKIENLTMKSSQCIAKYIVEFNRLATITGWDGRALRHQFYRGLPSRIKDELARIGKPATLPALKALAQSIDGRYWEREEETQQERGNQPSDRKGFYKSCESKRKTRTGHVVRQQTRRGREKIDSSLLEPARTSGCDDIDRAIDEVRLNAAAPFEPNTLFLPVTTSLLPNTIIFKALVDSGSTHCFIDSRFVEKKNMTTYPINPIRLKLFDGSSSSHMITKAIDIPLQIAHGHIPPFTFYVTMLDPSCVVVLGYNWLTRYNPLIDWVLSSITFRSTHIENPVPETRPSMRASISEEMELPSTSDPFDPEFWVESTTPPVKPKIDISLITAAAYLWACSLQGSQQFSLNLTDIEVAARLASTSD